MIGCKTKRLPFRRSARAPAATNTVVTQQQSPRYTTHPQALAVPTAPVYNPAYIGDVTHVSGHGQTTIKSGKVFDSGDYLHPVSRDDKQQRESQIYMSIAN